MAERAGQSAARLIAAKANLQVKQRGPKPIEPAAGSKHRPRPIAKRWRWGQSPREPFSAPCIPIIREKCRENSCFLTAKKSALIGENPHSKSVSRFRSAHLSCKFNRELTTPYQGIYSASTPPAYMSGSDSTVKVDHDGHPRHVQHDPNRPSSGGTNQPDRRGGSCHE